ncbi:hypothetical protein R1flu_013430 [Riccia fluitans]|uniref:Uncharacterized protein n=1 Tax=Riccia fluitans TaxID=41844 RepID=A0ABD1YD76_9MARC
MSQNLPRLTLKQPTRSFLAPPSKTSSSGNVDAAELSKEDEDSEIAYESEEEEEKQILFIRPAETTVREKDVFQIQKKEKKSMLVSAYEETFQKRTINVEAEEGLEETAQYL